MGDYFVITMKKAKYILPVLIISLSISFPVFATEEIIPTEDIQTEENLTEEIMTEESTELSSEELARQKGDYDGGGGPDYIDGLSPEDLSRQPSAGCSYVTFKAILPNSMKNVDKVTMECFDMNTYKDYAFNLYHINDYTVSAELPCGEYYIYTGGFYGDAIAAYPIEKKYFKVTDTNSVVEFKIGEEEENIEETQEFIEETISTIESEELSEEIEQTTMEIVEDKTTSNNSWISYLIEFIVIIILVLAVIFICNKKYRKENEE